MTTYAINATRGKEFEVEAELKAIGLHPWVPKKLASRYIKEKRQSVWFDKPAVGKLLFCVIPAIYYRDAIDLKHVIGQPLPLSQRDIDGAPAHLGPDGITQHPRVWGLKQFKERVELEYEDMCRRRDNSEWQCDYRPGQALEILNGIESVEAIFRGTIRRAYDDYAKLRVEMNMFGRAVMVEVDPDKVRSVV